MADEIDRRFMPDIFWKIFAMSLGATYRSVQMIKNPSRTLADMVSEVKSLITIPPETGSGIPDKAKALAGNWMQKGMDVMEQCRAAGEKFTGAE